MLRWAEPRQPYHGTMLPRAASRTSLLRACWSVPRRDAKVLASALKNGTLLSGSSVPGAKPEAIYKVVDKQHNKPGKGGAYIIAKMIDVHSGSQTNARWSSSCLLYTSPSPRDRTRSRMPSSA